MIFDNHMHSEMSSDSKMKIEEILKVQKENNLGVTITEHVDWNYRNPNLFRCDVKAYLKAYEKYRNDTLNLGIEIGLGEEILDKNIETSNNNFDLVLGSIHIVNDKDIFNEFFQEGVTKQAGFEEYFEFTAKCIELYDCFQVLSHLDYPSRYAPFKDPEMYYEDFSDHIDTVLRTLIRKDKVLELNTRRLNDKTAFNNLNTILKRYYDLGGRYISLGSDAHKPQDIMNNFEAGLTMLNSLNLTPVTFREKKLIPLNIK
ncbi:histidinol-phosphatase HisJ family protein [Inconstantimicrobium mannanitabidum]|uniref:Histidinol-phosphatase n=1 Tax=Inconstantimicrobium mannanitabidum TaxID=1604901 RepID=A0ACB5RCE5_9CLOT|nr:histidinol-phosphatase HisJ family protein [Clostridium sp. TW13]GKX66937.1 putative histidinol-phosphatase [Clostridium sp. TW13]